MSPLTEGRRCLLPRLCRCHSPVEIVSCGLSDEGETPMTSNQSRYPRDLCALARRPGRVLARSRARASTGSKPAEQGVRSAMGVFGRWFVGAECNTCYNAVDRHVERGRGEQPALIYDSPVTGTKRTYHLCASCRTRSRRSRRCCRTSASRKATASSSTCR